MIRHAGLSLPLPVGALAMPVSPPARLRLLIAVVGRTPLPPRFQPAGLAAVALTAIAMAANPKQGTAAGTATLPGTKRSFGFGTGRHPLLNS
jgi:hypothetical protein